MPIASISMWLAYNTNGLAHHRLDEACRLLADLGYQGVALTPDVAHLDPLSTGEREWEAFRGLLDRLKLRCVLETGARYLLDPKRKHWPNLCSRDEADAERRLEFYVRCCRMAKSLGAAGVSIWSGPVEEGDRAADAAQRLADRLKRALDAASAEGVRLCFEPEPGMLVDSLARYRELRKMVGRPDLATTIDVGHLIVTEPGPPESHLAEWKDSLINVQFPPIFKELRRMGYAGPLALELSRDSHRGAEAAAESIRTIAPMLSA
jgi:sugar phosphate isomerase/epimerase